MRTGVGLLAAALIASACSPDDPGPSRGETGQETRPSPLTAPVDLVVRQRSTTPLPGSDGNLFLTIDDITRKQVMVSLAPKDGGIVLAPESMVAGSSRKFRFRDVDYVLLLSSLETRLTGPDFARFKITSPVPLPTEAEKIERLLAIIAGLENVIFLRNGAEHPPKEAADHLRTKWKSRADEVSTAAQFIDGVASRSTRSGEPYRMRMADGAVVDVGVYLRARLTEIERGEMAK